MTDTPPKLSALKILVPILGGECEAFVPADFVESVLLPAVEHEVGHIVAAAHFGAIPIGIGIGLIPERSQSFHFQAAYGWEGWSTETRCIVSAAGPAADLIYRGAVNEAGASGDLNDIEALTGLRSLEPYLLKAQEILSKYNNEIVWTAAQLRSSLADGQWRKMIRLPNGKMVALFIDEAKFRECP